MHLLVASLVLAAAAAGTQAQQAPPQPPAAVKPPPPPPYNPTADAKTQIAAALKSAKDDGIRVLVNWGSNDDAASAAFATARRTPELSPMWSTEYKVVHVDVGRLDKNLEVAKTYGVTLSADTLPMLAVLDGDGNVLARTSASAFRSDADAAVFDSEKIAAFFRKHQAPPAPDAEPVLAAAVKQAKAEGKSLFVWFSAPW